MDKKPVFFVGGRLVDGKGQEVDAQGQPVAQAQASPAVDAKQVTALTAERDEAQVRAKELEGQVQALTAERDGWKDIAGTNQTQYAETLQRLDTLDAERAELQQGLQTAQQDRDALQQELDTLKAQPRLPADALERLKAVNGIADKLAQTALDALTAE